jgi:hypothetical protein
LVPQKVDEIEKSVRKDGKIGQAGKNGCLATGMLASIQGVSAFKRF